MGRERARAVDLRMCSAKLMQLCCVAALTLMACSTTQLLTNITLSYGSAWRQLLQPVRWASFIKKCLVTMVELVMMKVLSIYNYQVWLHTKGKVL